MAEASLHTDEAKPHPPRHMNPQVDRHRFTGRQGAGVNSNKGKDTGSTIRRYTARDVAPYVARIHRHNLPDGVSDLSGSVCVCVCVWRGGGRFWVA